MALRLGAVTWIVTAGLVGLTAAAAVRIMNTPAPPDLDVRRYMCADSRSLPVSGRALTEEERRSALAQGVRFPWTGRNGVPRQSAHRGNGVVRNGNDLNNVLAGTSGDDFFRGAEGDDRLIGGAGRDIYVFGKGDGYDTIEDSAGPNILQFLASIDLDDLSAQSDQAGGMVVRYGPHETVTIQNYAASGEWFVESSCGGDALPLAAVIARSHRP